MSSYIERHISFGVDEFEGLWKLSFLHPFFYADTKRVVTVYVVPPNSDYNDSEYNGIEVAAAGENMIAVMTEILPRIQKYPYRWELEGKKLDVFGYDLVSSMAKDSDTVGTIDFTDIAFAAIKSYYDFEEATPIPDVVIEDETITRNGALVKLGITLEKAQWANNISFDFFTNYPIEIASVMYQEDTQKYAAVYEIPLEGVQMSSTSLSLTFPSVFAKKFTIILAQSTCTISNASSSSDANDLLMNLSQESQELSNNLSLLTYNLGVYLDTMFEELWTNDVIDWEKSQQELSAAMSTSTPTASTSEDWRPEYQAARNKSDAQMQTYQQKLAEYQQAESKYKQDMEGYVKYQQQLADWYAKWGGQS
jgi:hypothetical protein